MADERVALMPQAELDEGMLAAMRAKIGAELRIDHSVNNDYASRIAVAKFAGGIGDINPLWTDADYGNLSPFGGPVAPPSFVIGCFSGIQFGWPGLGSFHSESQLSFERPIYWGDSVQAACVYDGFEGPSQSSFAGRTVTDHFTNTYTNQRGESMATSRWHVVNFERGSAARRRTGEARSKPDVPHHWTAAELAEIEARILAERPRGAQPRFWEDVEVGDQLDLITKGPIGLTDEIAFVAGRGGPVPPPQGARAAPPHHPGASAACF